MDGTDTRRDTGRRLRQLREALDYEQGEFAAMIGVNQPTYNNYETGLRLPSPSILRRVIARTGATTDWIYLGDRRHLPPALLEKLTPWDSSEDRAG